MFILVVYIISICPSAQGLAKRPKSSQSRIPPMIEEEFSPAVSVAIQNVIETLNMLTALNVEQRLLNFGHFVTPSKSMRYPNALYTTYPKSVFPKSRI